MMVGAMEIAIFGLVCFVVGMCFVLVVQAMAGVIG